MSRPRIIVDCETTSLTPDYATGAGVVWELALIERDCGAERLWRMEPDAELADPGALKVGRYRERCAGMRRPTFAEAAFSDVWDLTQTGHEEKGGLWSSRAELAPHVWGLLDGATLIAANPTFDAGFLAAFLAHHGLDRVPWHYRLRDIGSMAWAWLQAHHLPHHRATPALDASTDDFARALGIEPERFERHTALGDCRLIAAMLDVIEQGAAP